MYCHIIDKMKLAVIGLNSKNISRCCNRGIDTVKITALSNYKPGILNNYFRINIVQRGSSKTRDVKSLNDTVLGIFFFIWYGLTKKLLIIRKITLTALASVDFTFHGKPDQSRLEILDNRDTLVTGYSAKTQSKWRNMGGMVKVIGFHRQFLIYIVTTRLYWGRGTDITNRPVKHPTFDKSMEILTLMGIIRHEPASVILGGQKSTLLHHLTTYK